MKKSIVLLLIGVLLLAACGGETAPPEETRPVTPTPAPAIVTPTPEETQPVPAIEASTPTLTPELDESPQIYGDFEYRYCNYYKGLIITEYLGEGGDVVIPSEIDGFPVLIIGGFNKDAFNEANIHSVIIPEGVIEISGHTFRNNPSLTEIILPSSLKSIGSRVFDGCTSLVELNIPDNVTYIGYSDFGGNENLVITFRGKSYANQDIYYLKDVYFKEVEPDPDMVAEWNEAGEWDVSELFLVYDSSGKSTNHAYIVSLDGTVRRMEFTWDRFPIIEDYEKWCEEVILNNVNDDSIPIVAQFDRIPDDIIEQVRTLGPFVLDMSYGWILDASAQRRYIVIGSGVSRRVVKVGERQLYSSDNIVNELRWRINEWQREQWEKLPDENHFPRTDLFQPE
jgi:hypothetical protein